MSINDEWLFLSVFFYLLVAGTIFVYVLRVKKAGILEPIVQFLIFYTVFVVPLPLRALMTKQIEGDITEHLPQILPYMPIAVFIATISLPLFVLGYYSRFAKKFATRLPVPRTGKRLRLSFVALTSISIFLLFQLARGAGLLNFILLGYGASSEMYGRGYLAIGFPWLFIAAFFLLYRYAVCKQTIDLLLFGAALVLLITMFLVMGSRNMIVYMAISVALFWHYAIGSVSFKKLFFLGTASFLVLNILGYLRTSNYTSIADFWTKSSSAYEDTSAEKGRIFYTLTTGEFVVPFETLPQMIKSVGTEINPQFGLTYIKDALLWIPNVIFPDRPPTLTHWYMEKFYNQDADLNIGRSFFFLSEGYLNFGPIGVFATMLAWGVFFGIVNAYLQNSKGEPGAVMLCALTVAFIYRGIAGDVSSMFVGLPEQSLSAAVIGMWLANTASKHALWHRGSMCLVAFRDQTTTI